jgi:hypothetical protein
MYLRILDNSGSMEFEEGGERKNDLKLILSRVASTASIFDDDGISVRFMNWKPTAQEGVRLDGIRSEEEARTLCERAQYKGLTPLGTELRNQVVGPLIVERARRGQLQKPVLVITITDGQPAGEPKDALHETLRWAKEQMRLAGYGPNAIAFQFAQVGNDQAARKFLSALDEAPDFGEIVDCTSSTVALLLKQFQP